MVSSMDVKALCVTREQFLEGVGCGLSAIRKYKDQLIDFCMIGDYFYDNVTSYIIKDNVCYKTNKVFYDMDNNTVIMVALEDIDPINVIPSITGGGADIIVPDDDEDNE